MGDGAAAHGQAYRRVLGQLYLLRQAHEQDIWALGDFLVQLLLGGGALHIVGRLEALQEACEGAVDVFGENRHCGRRRCVVWARPVVVRGGGAVYYAGKGSDGCVLAGCWCGHGLRLPGDG
jgi:hypothetical protein